METETQLLTMVSEANGEFNFTKIPAGSYLVTVNAYGFAPFASTEFAVAVQQDYEVPEVSLSIAPANMEVTVRPTDLIAAEQIRAEEKQRLAGVIPNFYTSYIHDAAPLNWKQKFSRWRHGALSIPLSTSASASAPASNRRRTPIPGTGKVLRDIASVYAATFVDGRSSDFLTNALFPALFHQDSAATNYRGSGSLSLASCMRSAPYLPHAAIPGEQCQTLLICWATCPQRHCPLCIIPKRIGERTWSSPMPPLAWPGEWA